MRRTNRHFSVAMLVAVVALGAVAFADDSKALRLAAREGNLPEVQRLIEAGVPVNGGDAWGTTALALAVGQNQIEVVRYLLDQGADPSVREEFFGMSALDYALWKGEPEFETAKMLLKAGAKDRAKALRQALETMDPILGRTAADSGPFLKSDAEELRDRFGDGKRKPSEVYIPSAEAEFADILADIEIVPDPPPPVYSAKELNRFTGSYESREGATAKVTANDGKLTLDYAGATHPLTAGQNRTFRNADAGIFLRYSGRANTVEGMTIDRPGQDPVRLRPEEEGVTAEAPKVSAERLNASAEPTVHWPGFRGANRSGVGDGLDTPVDFDIETGRGIAWVADLPGLGNSSPVVWGDRVYVTTAIAEGGSTPLKVGQTGSGDEVDEAVEHRWMVLAFDKRTGEKLWETEVGRGKPLTRRHFKATQANSTPVTDGKHIVVVFPTAGLACLGMDGKIHWKRELGGLNAGGFNDPGLQWGFAASPILYKKKVILQVDIHDGAYLAAWKRRNGKLRWRTERPDVAPSWSTPAIWETPDGDELVVNASVIRGYDPKNGKELWSLGPTSVQVVAAPVLGEENLFVSSGYPPARPIYAVKPGIRGDHIVESDEDAEEASLAWYQTRGGAYMPTPLLYRDLLYVVHHNGRFVAHDAASGAKVHQARFSDGGTCTGSPVAANGKIYQGTEEGTLYVIEAGGEFKELALHDFGEPLMATPAISEGLLLVRDTFEAVRGGDVTVTLARIFNKRGAKR